MANYKVIEVKLKTVKDKILIYKIPEHEVNDKLTYFTRERGLIAKSLYEDFLIATCVANIQDFLDKLKKRGITSEKLLKIRYELVEKILNINPILKPDNLIINKNNVVKIKEDEEIDECILLIDNEYWDRDVYTKKKTKKRLNMDKIGNIQDLPHVKVQKFWKRIGQYITIKQFDPGSELTILGNRNFTSRHSFEQYIVTVCIHEVEDLFIRLDRLGLPQRVAPPILIHELYEICKRTNPFLDYDLYKDSFSTEDETVDPFAEMEAAYANPDELLDKTLRPQTKRIKTFRDIDSKELLKLDKKIKKKVIGQNKAIDDLVEAIQRASVGLKDPDKPIGAFLFTGRTGIGKSYCAKVLAEELIGNKRAIVVIDCSEYAADHEYAKLIGSPMGYVGHEQGGYLTNAVRKNPFSIVLFDEVEKASDRVHQLMLQIMDEGRLTDGKGKTTSFKDVVVIMTSNLGVEETKNIEKTIGFGDVNKLTFDKQKRAINEALKEKFKPEFLNRITRVINFNDLTKKDYLKIIKLELEKLKTNLKLNRTIYSKLKIEFDKSVYNYIYEKGIDKEYGARPLLRAIEREVSTPLAKKLLKEHDRDWSKTLAKISIKNNELNIELHDIEKEHDSPPFYMEATPE